uniref:Uncharacterized protein n=1 Tax=Myotis myotis TaxID=51298 RepID=A0A7J7ZWQ7_MYOMY|nr:hypothetical protein mMyoMyo1_009621 [Myotis myotis]
MGSASATTLHPWGPPAGITGPEAPPRAPTAQESPTWQEAPQSRTGSWLKNRPLCLRGGHTLFLRPNCSHHPQEFQTTGEVPAPQPHSGPDPQLYLLTARLMNPQRLTGQLFPSFFLLNRFLMISERKGEEK